MGSRAWPTPYVSRAVAATRGEVLMYGGEVCDARFSKCCGTPALDCPHDYLQPVYDAPDDRLRVDLTREQEAERFIDSRPDVFCHTADAAILSQVLNSYDRERRPDFFRWQVRYSARELSALVARRSGIDFGEITRLEPLRRGPSGRIVSLRIVGTRCEKNVGKELYIRRILSPSHLYSSAFVVRRSGTDFILDGAGWGARSWGMCQIGAAVMAHRGYDYRAILRHYYHGAELDCYYR